MVDEFGLSKLTAKQVLRLQRDRAGASHEEIANQLGKDRQTIGNYFGDEGSGPPLALLPKLCHILGSPDILQWLCIQYEEYAEDQEPARITPNAALIELSKALPYTAQAMQTLAEEFGGGKIMTDSDAQKIAQSLDKPIRFLIEVRRGLEVSGTKAIYRDLSKSNFERARFSLREPAGEDEPRPGRWRRFWDWLARR
jgi:transcriptional regulator with XRE-family HTH domain